MPDRNSVEALKNILEEIELLISTAEPLSQNRTPACLDLIRTASALADDIAKQEHLTPAAVMGHKGGSTTAQRGSDYFRQLAARRKVKAGGRPRKQSS